MGWLLEGPSLFLFLVEQRPAFHPTRGLAHGYCIKGISQCRCPACIFDPMQMMRFVFVVPSFNPQQVTMKFDDMQNQTRFLKGVMWHVSPTQDDLQQTTEEVS